MIFITPHLIVCKTYNIKNVYTIFRRAAYWKYRNVAWWSTIHTAHWLLLPADSRLIKFQQWIYSSPHFTTIVNTQQWERESTWRNIGSNTTEVTPPHSETTWWNLWMAHLCHVWEGLREVKRLDILLPPPPPLYRVYTSLLYNKNNTKKFTTGAPNFWGFKMLWYNFFFTKNYSRWTLAKLK